MLELGVWIRDPSEGQQNLRSLINLAVLSALRANGIDIPFPQRVLHASKPLASSLEKMSDTWMSRVGQDGKAIPGNHAPAAEA